MAHRDGDDASALQRRVWDRAAPDYDASMARLERIWFTGGREWLGARAVGRVLEVGVGTGTNVPHYPADAVVTGVDISPGMLAEARSRMAALGRPVTLLEGDAQRLPVDDAAFDTVVCALALCSIPQPAVAIREMHRVLVPGGRLLLLDHVASSAWPLRAAQRLVELVSVRVAGEHFTRRQLPLVEAAGFTIDEDERLKLGTIERIRATKRT
ncbi:class I SAM-dependent methyltransferase [Agrococcus jenensis]|uniref:Phosphatidylethanolamine N-methyltransferase /phosphatidyl-N-methylethanolamine N-methyltransferase n=1 Tax=Agrococcus jenensis TaxID=46353 RepID=A0A3N2AUX6_9MICO|nr:methyltransferase domain-containing protein [Agrococcus jenensis]ROR66834.1 phosphatidylethanolamine N-methyltransferase /phosphatidyl-N-methylethanolamine N-methyltransferase [Agrococcus jenensis]